MLPGIAPMASPTSVVTSTPPGPSQSLLVSGDAGVQSFERDTYSALMPPPPPPDVVWPFSASVGVASTIGSGFGHRSSCPEGCSTNHMGQDFTPERGTPVLAVADGVVVESTDAGGGFGVKIVIRHRIDGAAVESVYGHMQPGSRLVGVGQTVHAGQQIGSVGSTGVSTGPHLHLEIHVWGTPVDPLSWMRSHT